MNSGLQLMSKFSTQDTTKGFKSNLPNLQHVNLLPPSPLFGINMLIAWELFNYFFHLNHQAYYYSMAYSILSFCTAKLGLFNCLLMVLRWLYSETLIREGVVKVIPFCCLAVFSLISRKCHGIECGIEMDVMCFILSLTFLLMQVIPPTFLQYTLFYYGAFRCILTQAVK